MYCLERGDNVFTLLKNVVVGFVNVVTGLVDFVIGFIEDCVHVVILTGEFVLKIPTLFSWLPSEAVALVIMIFGVVVVYKVLGREG